MEQRIKIMLLLALLVASSVLLGLMVGMLLVDDPTPQVNVDGMRQMNILCSSNHNHPLFQNYTICGYVPNLNERVNNELQD